MIENKNTARLNGFHERLAKKERIENDGKKTPRWDQRVPK